MNRQVTCPACQGQKTQAQPQAGHGQPALTLRCPNCRGKGTLMQTAVWRLRIPADSAPNDVLRMAQAGPMGQDLMAHLRIDPHPLLRAWEHDLYVDMPLRPSQAVLGGMVILHLPHKALEVRVPEGCQTGELVVLEGEGLKGRGRNARGKLHITFDVELPKPSTMSPDHRAAWQNLAQAEAQDEAAFSRAQQFVQGIQH
jgi:DnaJ-class molecular chaperone